MEIKDKEREEVSKHAPVPPRRSTKTRTRSLVHMFEVIRLWIGPKSLDAPPSIAFQRWRSRSASHVVVVIRGKEISASIVFLQSLRADDAAPYLRESGINMARMSTSCRLALNWQLLASDRRVRCPNRF